MVKLAHLADLHLGKTVNGFSMVPDQSFILKQIVDKLKSERVDGVLIAGDVYDKAVPSGEAVDLLDEFLADLFAADIEVFMVAGNHDSAVRLSYGGRLFDRSGVHVCGRYDGQLARFACGGADIYLLPYVRLWDINRFIEDEKDRLSGLSEAIGYVLGRAQLDKTRFNIIVSHQYVTGAAIDTDGSEELIIGGLDQVDGHVYDAFDYVALGHIHRGQKVRRETMRYAGTPLAYSLGESGQEKTIPVLTIDQKNVGISFITINPLRRVRRIRGTYKEIIAAIPAKEEADDYVAITLTDETDVPEAIRYLRNVYPNIMRLDYDNARTRASYVNPETAPLEKRAPGEIFAEFFEKRTGKKMSDKQSKIIADLIDEAQRGDI